MYKDTITIFNKKPGSRTTPDTWYPTVIEGVDLNADRAAIMAKYGPESQDSAILHIRYTSDSRGILVAEKPWMPPKEWDGTEDALTFAPGDFFYKGMWDGGIVTDEDYPADGFYGYMNETHDYVFTVSSVAKYSVIPHFEIMGK